MHKVQFPTGFQQGVISAMLRANVENAWFNGSRNIKKQ